MPITALVWGTILEPTYKADQLGDRFVVGKAPFLGGRQLGIAQHAGLRIAAGPRDDRGGTGGEEIDPLKRARFVVERDRAALDLILADVVAGQIKVERSFELAGMGTAAGKLALPPPRQEFFVNGQEAPPAQRHALGIGLEIGPTGDQVEVGPVRAVAVQEDDLLEPVISQAFRDVENSIDEVLKVRINGSGKSITCPV